MKKGAPGEVASLDSDLTGAPDSQSSTLNAQPPFVPDHELLRCIGRGSYGEVWLARSVLGEYRAAKVIHRRAFGDNRPFEREFEGIQRYEPISRSHESQVQILHVGINQSAGYFYYVMELADEASSSSPVAADVRRLTSSDSQPASLASQPDTQSLLTSAVTLAGYIPKTLRSLITPDSQPSTLNSQPTTTRLPFAQCIDIGLALTTALAHLHKQGLVHRDIKPSNIIFVKGRPKLADIGLVTDAGDAQSIVGTEGYFAPEGPGTAQADLYALGMVLYEISTGRDRRHFPDLPLDLAPLSAERGTRNVESPSEAPQPIPHSALRTPHLAGLLELNEILLQACARDVRQRYQSAEEMHADLEVLQNGRSVRRKRAAERLWGVVKKSGVVATVLALVATVAALLVNRLNDSARQHSNDSVPINSLAVLPFDNDSTDKADEILATEMAEELGSTLMRIPGLRVIGRNSAIALKGANDVRQAARQLNLGAVLDGRIQKVNDRLRVSAQLINTTDGFVLWSEVYEVGMADLLGLQTKLAESVAEALHLKLTDSVRSRLAVKSPPNLEAYRLYLEGRFLWHKRSADGLIQSIDRFQQAIRLEPTFARAYVGLADAYNILDNHGLSPAKESKPKAREAVLKALALDDTLPEAHASLAKVLMEFDWDWRGAAREFKLAIKLDPNYATARQWYSQFLEAVGRPDEALEQIKIAVGLDPLSCILLVNLASRHFRAGRYEHVIECSRQAREIDPNFGSPVFAQFYEQQGRYDEAVEEWERFMKYNSVSPQKIATLKAAYAESGIKGFWRKRLELMHVPSDQESRPSFGFGAELHARLGESDEALESLEQAVADHSTYAIHMNTEPAFASLRSHSRFVALLKQMGLEK